MKKGDLVYKNSKEKDEFFILGEFQGETFCELISLKDNLTYCGITDDVTLVSEKEKFEYKDQEFLWFPKPSQRHWCLSPSDHKVYHFVNSNFKIHIVKAEMPNSNISYALRTRNIFIPPDKDEIPYPGMIIHLEGKELHDFEYYLFKELYKSLDKLIYKSKEEYEILFDFLNTKINSQQKLF